ncbi:MAG: ribonuclease H-like YkuK family protein [Niabella sp.]
MGHINKWRKLTGEYIKSRIEDELHGVIVREKMMGNHLKVYIGTDSQVKGAETEFATAIVFLRKGNGGFMYLNNEITCEKMSIRQRMMAEVAKTVQVAYHLSTIFTNHAIDMEVHVDINKSPVHKSNEALKEAIGYITGMGFAYKTKPEAFASSCCANKVVQ